MITIHEENPLTKWAEAYPESLILSVHVQVAAKSTSDWPESWTEYITRQMYDRHAVWTVSIDLETWSRSVAELHYLVPMILMQPNETGEKFARRVTTWYSEMSNGDFGPLMDVKMPLSESGDAYLEYIVTYTQARHVERQAIEAVRVAWQNDYQFDDVSEDIGKVLKLATEAVNRRAPMCTESPFTGINFPGEW